MQEIDPQAPCELVGPTGGTTRVRLIEFDGEAGTALLQAPQARKPVAIRFEQFLRLALLTPVPPLPSFGGDKKKFRPEFYHVTHKSGQTSFGLTLGVVDRPAGLFLFEPVDEQASIRRVFIPRAGMARFHLGAEAEALITPAASTTAAEVEAVSPSASAAPAPASLPSRAEKVAEILSETPATTAKELEVGIARQARMPIVRLGEALVALGHISAQQLQAAIEEQRSDRGVPIGELLVRKGLVTRENLQSALARKMGYPVVDLSKFPPDMEALVLVNKALAIRVQALPLMVRQGRLIVAVEDPSRAKALDEVEFAAGCKVVPVLALAVGLPELRMMLRDGEASARTIALYAVIFTPAGVLALAATPPDLARLLIALVAVGAFLLVLLPQRPAHVPGRGTTMILPARCWGYRHWPRCGGCYRPSTGSA